MSLFDFIFYMYIAIGIIVAFAILNLLTYKKLKTIPPIRIFVGALFCVIFWPAAILKNLGLFLGDE